MENPDNKLPPPTEDPWRTWHHAWTGWRVLIIIVILVAIAALTIAIIAMIMIRKKKKTNGKGGCGSCGSVDPCGCAPTCDDNCTLSARIDVLEKEETPISITSELLIPQVIPSGAATELIWDSDVVAETQNWPASLRLADNRRFFPPKRGRYLVNASVSFFPNDRPGDRVVVILKNGNFLVPYGKSSDTFPAASASAADITASVFLETTDYASVYVFQTTGGPLTTSQGPTSGTSTNLITLDFLHD